MMRRGVRQDRTVLVHLGAADDPTRQDWLSSGLVSDIVDLRTAAPDGMRHGRRALGLGVDSVVVALIASICHPHAHFVAANPWVGVALRCLGRPVSVTGIYATPGTRSWRILRRCLGRVPVVTTSATEAENWNRAGGSATPVRYGSTFGYPPRVVREAPRVSVFVGGSSDRDLDALSSIIRDTERIDAPLDFVLCIGRAQLDPGVERLTRVKRHPTVTQDEFGRLLGASDVVFLPLAERNRSAGHMVAIGALEAGVPVVATATAGMEDYFSLPGIHRAEVSDQVQQLLRVGLDFRGSGDDLRRAWGEAVSRKAYTSAVAAAFAVLDRNAGK